jgi:methyltransferase
MELKWFEFVISALIFQRCIEMMISRRNEKVLRSQGAIEFGAAHFKVLILLHVFFFLSLFLEAYLRGLNLPSPSVVFLIVLLLIFSQAIRAWTMLTLKHRWVTRILVVPGSLPIQSGPYAYLKHPNYAIVAVELFCIPILFGLSVTAIVFTVLNAWILLMVRIPVENRALR